MTQSAPDLHKVYGRMDTGSFVVEAVLAELGLRFERILVPRDRPISEQADFLAVNPRGQVPAVITPQGETLTESAAIIFTLAERHPEGDLLPPTGSPERARLLRWLFFAAANLYESDLRYYYADRFSSEGRAAAKGVREAAAAAFDGSLILVENEIARENLSGPYFFGERFSVIDPYLSMLMTWHWEPEKIRPRIPLLARLMEATLSRPAIAPLHAEHQGRAAQ